MAMYNADGDIPLSGFRYYDDAKVTTFQQSDYRIPRRPVGSHNASPLLSERDSQYTGTICLTIRNLFTFLLTLK